MTSRITEYDYLSGDLLRTAYPQAAGRALSAAPALDLPGAARRTVQYLLDRALSLDTAQPGDYLHVPDMSLDFIDWSAGPGSWTAALFTNSQAANELEAGRILLVLAGPVEDCQEWVPHGNASRMPVPGTTLAMKQAIETLGGKALEDMIDELYCRPARRGRGGAGDPVPMLAHALTGALRREALARVLIREAARPPYASIVIGVPLWVRVLAPN